MGIPKEHVQAMNLWEGNQTEAQPKVPSRLGEWREERGLPSPQVLAMR